MGVRNDELLARYQRSVMGVFGLPPLVLSHGSGCHVWDVDGNRYLDLVGGIAVNALGHGHPALVAAISKQAGEAIHVSNLFTSEGQIALAERLIDVAGAPEGSAVFFANSGAEAIEAAIKLSRRTGRSGLVAAEGAFHGRTTGALALTHKVAYREPFEPLIPGVTHVPYGDEDALRAAVGPDTAAVVLEPVQGEAGVLSPGTAYLRLARELTAAHGALLVLDEIQTGIGRTGEWFAAATAPGVEPDVVTLAKGLGGGIPIGACIGLGTAGTLLQPGQHGTTFGGNPVACAAALAVLDTIEDEGLLERVTDLGAGLRAGLSADGRVTAVRGRGLLIGLDLTVDAPAVVAAARARGFLINATGARTVRLAPPLVLGHDEAEAFRAAWPGILDDVAQAETGAHP
jgi:acetylornithine aminotransferase